MENEEKERMANEILQFTSVHPYYSQQLAAATYNIIMYGHTAENAVCQAIRQQVEEHSLDYERLWISLKRTDRKILTLLAKKSNPLTDRSLPTSTAFSAIKRLVKQGYVSNPLHTNWKTLFLANGFYTAITVNSSTIQLSPRSKAYFPSLKFRVSRATR